MWSHSFDLFSVFVGVGVWSADVDFVVVDGEYLCVWRFVGKSRLGVWDGYGVVCGY